MDDNCHVYLHRGSIRISGKCGGTVSSTVYDDGIKMKVGECFLLVACSGPEKIRCLRSIACDNLPLQTEHHDWNKEYHFKFKTQ